MLATGVAPRLIGNGQDHYRVDHRIGKLRRLQTFLDADAAGGVAAVADHDHDLTAAPILQLT